MEERVLDEEVERYVRTGQHDNYFFLGWPGSDLIARARHATAEDAPGSRATSECWWARMPRLEAGPRFGVLGVDDGS